MGEQKKVIVIGGGPGGYVAAIRAAQLGAAVTLIEKEHLGGTCLNVGCIPTKALLHPAEIAASVREGVKFGIHATLESVNWTEVLNYKNDIVKTLTGGVHANIKPSAQWDFFRHIGPYVDGGAQVLATDYASQIAFQHAIPMSERFVMAFRNPDGSYAIVATNTHEGMDRKVQLQVKLGGQYTWFQLPSKSDSTIIIRR